MSTEETIWTIFHLVVAFAFWTRLYKGWYRWNKRTYVHNTFDSEDRYFIGCFLLGIVALIWPISLPVVSLWVFFRFFGKALKVGNLLARLEKV